MNWEPPIALGVALLGFAGAWIQRQGIPGKDRRRLRSDAEIFGLLPKGSTGRRLMGQHLDAEVERLIAGEAQSSGLVWGIASGVGVFLFYAIPAGILIGFAVDRGGLWWVGGAVGFLFLGVGVMGLIAFVTEKLRDDKSELEKRRELVEARELAEAERSGQKPVVDQ